MSAMWRGGGGGAVGPQPEDDRAPIGLPRPLLRRADEELGPLLPGRSGGRHHARAGGAHDRHPLAEDLPDRPPQAEPLEPRGVQGAERSLPRLGVGDLVEPVALAPESRLRFGAAQGKEGRLLDEAWLVLDDERIATAHDPPLTFHPLLPSPP